MRDRPVTLLILLIAVLVGVYVHRRASMATVNSDGTGHLKAVSPKYLA